MENDEKFELKKRHVKTAGWSCLGCLAAAAIAAVVLLIGIAIITYFYVQIINEAAVEM